MKTDYTVMKVKVIGASAKALGVEVKGDIVNKHHLLTAHFKKLAAKGETLFECDACGGLATENFQQCPYCGQELDDDEAAAQTEAALDDAVENSVVEIVTTAEPVTELTVAELDASVTAIRFLRKGAEKSLWELGESIRDNHERGLWKLRMKEGKVAYTNYRRFVEAELGMSHTMAYSLIEVATKFTREDVAEVGVTKLAIIAKIEDPEKRSRALEGAKNGASKREVVAIANEGKEPEPGEPVSFMVRSGPILTFPLKRASDGEAATRIEVGLWAEEEHENGVVSAYSVEEENGVPVLRINRYRG